MSEKQSQLKSIMRLNAEKDATYRPYCLRCPGLVRMTIVDRFLWACACGAVHDERTEDEVRGQRIRDMVNMEVWLTGGVGLTNGGRGWP